MKSIETERVILRKFKTTDIEDMWEWCTDKKVGPMAGWPVHQDRNFTLRILTGFIDKEEVYAIYHKDTDKVIGSIGAHKRNVGNPYDVEIGYVMNSNYWNYGLMTEACQALISYIFEETSFFRISVSHFSINSGSRRVIEKCGFTHEGTMRKARITPDGILCDSIKYSILKEEYTDKLLPWQKEEF